MSALDDLRSVVRIARAASSGVIGNAPRIAKAETALADVAELIGRVDYVCRNGEGMIALRAALAKVTGGAA